jgi:predicted DNA-binding transcriptional regulator YafY
LDLNKSQKLVKIVELMSRVGGVRASELRDRFDLDARSMRRYLSDLRGLDLPLVDEGRGDERILAVQASWRRTGVQLTLSEVLSLHFGRKLFNFLDGTSFATDLDGAIERLRPAISRTNAELSEHLDRKFLAVPEHGKNYSGDTADVIDDVITALLYNHPVDIRYRRSDGITRHYRLHLYTMAIFRQALYVFAYDVAADRVKTFAIERIAEIARQRREHFVVPSSWDPEGYIEHAFGIISGTPLAVKISFSPEVRTLVLERCWHPTQSMERRGDGWLELTMKVAVTVELVSWVCGFGADARVLEPPTLAQQVRRQLASALAWYEREEA